VNDNAMFRVAARAKVIFRRSVIFVIVIVAFQKKNLWLKFQILRSLLMLKLHS
jgi:hypothetical protein